MMDIYTHNRRNQAQLEVELEPRCACGLPIVVCESRRAAERDLPQYDDMSGDDIAADVPRAPNSIVEGA